LEHSNKVYVCCVVDFEKSFNGVDWIKLMSDDNIVKFRTRSRLEGQDWFGICTVVRKHMCW